MKIVTIASFVFLLTGCVVAATEEGMAVRMIDKQSDYNCKFVRTITGSGSMGWTPAGDAQSAMNSISNKAAKAGANAVRVVSANSTEESTIVIAEALNCEFDE